MRIVVMGVSGSGKTAVGKELGKRLRLPFYDGDTFHSEECRAKMAAGVPLSDADREPWLGSLAELLREHPSIILACSALKATYREQLRISPDVLFVYLKGSYELICTRMEGRKGHFFNPTLLKSQFETLEEPEDALVVEISPPVSEIVTEICKVMKH
ncbi:MAG: Thermoresistant gluconokinase [Chlamydiae bacterium]|nr:Thermoresistant gluconokinase [Chlamydiota bacterium]